MNFTRDKEKPLKTLGIGRTVLDELRDHPVCRSINDPEKDVNPRENPDFRVIINPLNQQCFNHGTYNAKDLYDWMNGTGPIVKGKNQKEKDKYFQYATAEAMDKDHVIWSIAHHWRWFKMFETNYNPHNHKANFGISQNIEDPIIVRACRNFEDQVKRDEEIIIKMFAPLVNEIKSDMEYRTWQNIRYEFEKNMYGIKRTLYCMGGGYFGASNTPEDIRNLHWVTDLVFAKGYYLFLKEKEEKGEITLPDFEWIYQINFIQKIKKEKSMIFN